MRIVKLLLRAGAAVNSENAKGQVNATALRFLQRFSIITPQSPLNAQAFQRARDMISRACRLQWTWPSSSTSMMWESAPPPRSPAALFNLPACYSR